MGKYEKRIKRALRSIFKYTDTDEKYVHYAEVISTLEHLIKDCMEGRNL